MPNADTPFGARLIQNETGSYPPVRAMLVASTYATVLFMGDFVDTTGTSALSSELGIYLPTVEQSAATSVIYGFIVGFAPNRTYENQIYRTASTERVVYVCDSMQAEFEMQASAAFAVTDAMANADIVVGSGSTVTGLSGMEVDSSTFNTTATLPIRVVGVVPREDNEVGSNNTKLICRFNDAFFRGNTGL